MADTRFDDYYAIIPHPATSSFLFLQSDDGWTLPKATVPLSPDDGRWRDVFRVNAAFQRLLGITVTVLECLFVSPFPAIGQHGNSVFAMSNHDNAWILSAEGAWITLDEIDTLTLANSDHRVLLANWLTRLHSPLSERLPWTYDGWFEEATAWIQAQFRQQGLIPTGPIEQTRSWFVSSILRLTTITGDVYFKAVSSTDVHEPMLTQMLAAQHPMLVPPVLAVQKEKRWLLTNAVSGKKMPSGADPSDYLARWKNLLQTYACMQRDYAQYTEQLLALDCHDWRLELLAEQIDPFLAELPTLLQGAQHPLTTAEQQQLQRIVPYLKTACTKLALLDIPASLHHGDFHRGNIIVNENGCTLLDWAGFVGVAHPFLSLWVPLDDWDQQARQQLCESYLEMWSDYASMEHLQAALTLAHPLAALCGALGHRHQLLHAHTALPWDTLSEQQNMLDCLRGLCTSSLSVFGEF